MGRWLGEWRCVCEIVVFMGKWMGETELMNK